ncbi:MAG: UDP-N-acetylmuramoyl-L-alanine--D-glutamate ligase [Acidobacteria bacterium]|nr:MAG: UDP-N-acetylmuramoyl-L-alanine--D-glutamate ligase [Acidobacteriota bacterium]REK00466.1 MAG: UDP-N-acetylmuramoyl-L-alanine--D-glutamate ligase [Acidobacteriota bacterium]
MRERVSMSVATPGTGSGAFAWRRALVYGWGLSGRAAAELLADRGCAILAVEDGKVPEEIALRGADGSPVELVARRADQVEELPGDVDLVVVSPGVPQDRPLLRAARERGVTTVGELELGSRAAGSEMVAITGSNGKSTTTELTGALLRAAGHEALVCGNIGLPLSRCALRARSEPESAGQPRVYVVEVSSFQLETVEGFRPRVAALLNLSPDHIDRHGSYAAYAAAKRRLFERQGSGDVAVLNADDAAVASTELPPKVRRRLFSRLGPVEDGAHLVVGEGTSGEGGERRTVVLEPGGEPVVGLDEIRLRGEHNAENVLAACAIADAYLAGAQRHRLAAALRSFAGLPHRMQRIAEVAGVEWFDDSKGTNVGATVKSLEGFCERQVHLILGGTGKGADFTGLRQPVERAARRVYLIGTSADQIAGTLEGVVPIERCGDLETAVRSAAARARSGEAVVLSPACASFDQFRDYAHRGEVFQQLVQGLSGAEGGAAGTVGTEVGDG